MIVKLLQDVKLGEEDVLCLPAGAQVELDDAIAQKLLDEGAAVADNAEPVVVPKAKRGRKGSAK